MKRHESGCGLRERKREATRLALGDAAMKLVIRRGIANVTVEEIAAKAGVSPRTFFNYFPSKEEALTFADSARSDAVIAEFRSRPESEPLWTSLRLVFDQVLTKLANVDAAWAAEARIAKANPSVQARMLHRQQKQQDRLAAAIAERPEFKSSPLVPQLVTALLFTALKAAVDTWIEAPEEHSLPELVDNAFVVLQRIDLSQLTH